jgi:molybdate transport system substrate-binding protein
MMTTGATVATRAVSRPLSALASAAFFMGGCAGTDSEDRKTQLSILAASSLTEAFTAMEVGFETAHPDVDVVMTFAGSQVLRLQVEQGASADLFASANEAHAYALADAGLAEAPRILAHNRLALILPPDNPAEVSSFGDLPQASRLVVGTDHVPLGVYTRAMLDRADVRLGRGFADRVRARVVSKENNARLVRAKVGLGEADAAIVYQTDAMASDRVLLIEIPEDVNVRTPYVTAVLTEAAGGAASPSAADFVAFTRSEEGRAILVRYGFDVEGA